MPNIIANGADGWMYIDPRGVTGEHAYDAAVLAIRITTTYSPQSIKMLTADLAQVSVDRLTAWMTVADAARV